MGFHSHPRERSTAARPGVELLEARELPSTIQVLTTADAGPNSLRQAILDSNANPGMDTVSFNIGAGGHRTITPTSPLPTITDPIVIDGTTQPGFQGIPLIELSGDQAGSSADGLRIIAGNSTVRGLIINRSSHYGIWISGGGDNVVEGNFIGTDASGRFRQGNASIGVAVLSNGNRIGGTNESSRNLVSGNGSAGIAVSQAAGNVVQGNYVGTDMTGTIALGNGQSVAGISLFGSNNTLGGLTPGAGNLISGNAGNVAVSGTGHTVQGNLIGTDVTGTVALGGGGMSVNGSNHLIGGIQPGAGNVISGNQQGWGINISGASVSGIIVQGNLIGTDVTGTRALVVHFTNNVVVSRFLGLRQQKLPKNAATHVLASPSDPVE